MNYCLNFSTHLYYEHTNCKIGLMKARVQVNKVILYYIVKQIMNTDFCYPNAKILTNTQTNWIFLAALIHSIKMAWFSWGQDGTIITVSWLLPNPILLWQSDIDKCSEYTLQLLKIKIRLSAFLSLDLLTHVARRKSDLLAPGMRTGF